MTEDEIQKNYQRVNVDATATYIRNNIQDTGSSLSVAFQFLYLEILKNRRYLFKLQLGTPMDNTIAARELEGIELLMDKFAESLGNILPK
jgi:hypothetical protein